MAKESGKRAMLGVFVSSALIVLMVALYFVGKKQQLFGTSFRLSGVFVDVSGLQVGNNVRLAGVNVGSVEAVTILSGRQVRVEMVIAEDARKFIKKDAVASVGSESMMGNKVIVLASGGDESPPIADLDVIKTAVPVTIDDILAHLNHTGKNVVALTGDLASLTGTIRSGKGTLGTIFINKQFAADMSETLLNLKEGSAGMKGLMEATRRSWLLWGSGQSKEEEKAEKVLKEKADEQEAEAAAAAARRLK